MSALRNACAGLPELALEVGDVLVQQGTSTGKLHVLIDGELSVLRDDTEVARIDEPGAIVGEMSIFLAAPHTATVTARQRSRVHVVEDGRAFLRSDPDVLLEVARTLAARLQMLTGYLADLKQQYGDRDDHLGMVDQILICLSCQQDAECSLGSERESGPKT